MKPQVQLLISLHLLVLACGPIELKLDISILNNKLIAFVLKICQLTSIVLLSLQQIFKFLLESDLHFCCVLAVLVEDFFKMPHNVFLGQIVNSIGLIHVEGIEVRGFFDAVVSL
jgi:hypothetical protein